MGGPRALVARLANETIEIIAPKSVTELGQLTGRKVSYGPIDSADGATAAALFSRLGVSPKPIREPLPASLNDLAAGKIDAIVIAGAGNSAVADFGKDGRFHLVAIPGPGPARGLCARAADGSGSTEPDRPRRKGRRCRDVRWR